MSLATDQLDAADPIELRPLTPSTGAEISGVDLRAPLGEAEIAALRRALVEHGVIVFRDQPVTPDQQVAFARRFGHVPEVPDSMFRVHPENAHVSILENDAEHPPTVNNWHSDYSFAAEPDMASLLRAVVVPDLGGDTIWVNTANAYDALPDRVQRHIEGLSATFDFMRLYERPQKKHLWEGARRAHMEAARQAFPPVSHPIVRMHPETGRKTLFVDESFTRHIDGMSDAESCSLLDFLFQHLRTPEYQMRLRWTKDTVVFWDNRCAVHYAVADYYPRHRLVHRVTVLERSRS